MRPRLLTLSAFIAVFWLGTVIGVSFLASPIKFTAETLSREAAFDVGRVTFQAFAMLEWALGGLLLICTLLARANVKILIAPVALTLLVVFQGLNLLPALDARADMVIAGHEPPASWHHMAYVWAEGAKVILLFGTAYVLNALARRG